MKNDIYYKIKLTKNDFLTVVCMQWFDEYDYDQNDFMTDENGEQLIFYDYEGGVFVDGESRAIQWLT